MQVIARHDISPKPTVEVCPAEMPYNDIVEESLERNTIVPVLNAVYPAYRSIATEACGCHKRQDALQHAAPMETDTHRPLPDSHHCTVVGAMARLQRTTSIWYTFKASILRHRSKRRSLYSITWSRVGKYGWTKFVSMQNHYDLPYREREMSRYGDSRGIRLI